MYGKERTQVSRKQLLTELDQVREQNNSLSERVAGLRMGLALAEERASQLEERLRLQRSVIENMQGEAKSATVHLICTEILEEFDSLINVPSWELAEVTDSSG